MVCSLSCAWPWAQEGLWFSCPLSEGVTSWVTRSLPSPVWQPKEPSQSFWSEMNGEEQLPRAT